MADQYLNPTDLAAIRDWINGKFALDADLDTLSDRVDDIVAEGGEPNVIETISNKGTNIPPTNKNIDLSIPSTVAELSDASDYALAADVPTAASDLTNDGDGTSPFATQAYVSENGGKIQKIKVNHTEQTIDTSDKSVDITVPTKVSDLTNDSGFQTSSDVDGAISDALANSGDAYQTASDVASAISTSISSVYRYKGSVATKSALPANADNGDVYDVQSNGVNYAWNGTTWDALRGEFDASLFWQKTELTAMTVAEVNAILEPSS